MSDVTLAEELRRLHCRSHHPSEPVSLAVNAIDKLRERVSALEDGRADGEPALQESICGLIGEHEPHTWAASYGADSYGDTLYHDVRCPGRTDGEPARKPEWKAMYYTMADANAENKQRAEAAERDNAQLAERLARAEGERDAVIARARLENQAYERIAGQALQEKGNEMAYKCVAQSHQQRAEVERDAAREILAKYEALELAVARWRLDLGSSREITSAHEDLQQALDGES